MGTSGPRFGTNRRDCIDNKTNMGVTSMKFLQSARKHRGLTQKDLAVRLGVSVQQVSNWEREVAAIPQKHHIQISGVLEIPETDIQCLDVIRILKRKYPGTFEVLVGQLNQERM